MIKLSRHSTESNPLEYIEILPCGPLDVEVRPPGSKSITNRAMVCAALADGPSCLTGALDSDDTQVMAQALADLGFEIRADWASGRISLEGSAGTVPASNAALMLDNSGTTMRFLTALCCLGRGEFTLDGSERMRQRPIGPLCRALTRLGARLECQSDCPPVKIAAAGLRGGTALIDGSQSSQFVSAVLMALPYAREYSVVRSTGASVSIPYIRMTCQVMRQFGVDVLQLEDAGEYSIDPRHRYRATQLEIEPDATAASYCWAAAAIAGGRVRVTGLGADSIQGDVRFAQVLEEAGCAVTADERGIQVAGPATRPVNVDMSDISDTVQTLAAVAMFLPGTTTIRGVAHNRLKETDRIGNLAIELRKMGADVEELADGLAITPRELRGATIKTWNDHRMAMALALVGLRQPGIVIEDPGCVSKTWPNYFAELSRWTGNP